MTDLPIADLADTLARVLHPEYNVAPLKDAILVVDKLLGQIEEARMWARHGYEIGQRSNTWSDHGVAPAWLTEGHSFGWHVLSACPDEAACAIHGRNEPGGDGPEDGVNLPECAVPPSVCEARRCTQAAPTGSDDTPALTREEALELVDDLGLQAYRAEDRLAFVREMCDQADRDGTPITTERVRSWLAYEGCGGALRLPDEVMPLLRDFAAGEGVAAPATPAGEPVDFVTETFGDGSQRTRLDRLTDGRVMCCLCFEYTPREGLEPADDGSGDLTDVCKSCAAKERR